MNESFALNWDSAIRISRWRTALLGVKLPSGDQMNNCCVNEQGNVLDSLRTVALAGKS